jgi:heme-degrading monooxygenase HmoA
MARYKYTGDAQDLGRRIEEGMLPIFQSQPGFKGYTIAASDTELVSLSSWESFEAAEAANKLAASWVAKNMASELQLEDSPIDALILFSTMFGISTKAGSTP